MSQIPPLPRLPIVLLAALSLVSFGGPFALVGTLRGGESGRWPPDRPIEWIVIGVVMTLFLVLFVACVTLRIWFKGNSPGARDSQGS